MEARAREGAARCRPAGRRRPFARGARGSEPRRRRRTTRPGASNAAAGSATISPPCSRKSSRRFASISGTRVRARRPRARRASRRRRPGMSSASASPRAAASPMRTPVKLPGPMPTASASSSARLDARVAQQRVDVLEHANGASSRARRAPRRRGRARSSRSTWRCQTRVSARSIVIARRSRPLCRMRTRKRGARQHAGSRLGPLDERDGVVEVRLEISPLRVRDR